MHGPESLAAASAAAQVVVVAGLRQTVEHCVLVVEDIQVVVVDICKVLLVERVRCFVDTVMLLSYTVEVDMVLALELQKPRRSN